MTLRSPAGLDRLTMENRADPGEPGFGEIRVALHASSLNFHDLGVVLGFMPTEDGRIPLADGAGVVESVGADVTEFAPGDLVGFVLLSRLAGWHPTIGDFSRTPGDGIDGFAQEYAVLPATAFTYAPRG